MSDSEGSPPGRAAPLRVLMLEDSRFDAELLREHLVATYPSADVHWVPDGARYLALLHGPLDLDLILSDYEIPGYSGMQALEAALVRRPETPFVFVSGVIGEDNAVEMMKRGATDYVSKSRLGRLPVVIDRARREVRERRARASAESRLREADVLYGRVVDSLPDYAVILLDRRGHVRGWNRAAHDIFGHDRDTMLGRSANVLFTPDDQAQGTFEAELAAALAAGKKDCDCWMARADGTLLRAEGVVTPLFGDQGDHTGFCKIVHDVTASYEAALALRAAKEEAERASRAKDRFLAMLSHELRTPLTPIAAAAHVLERFAQVPERYRDLVPMIRRNVAIESRLIDDLLDLTSIAAGKLRLERTPLDVHVLVRHIVEMVEADVRAKQLALTVDLAAPEAVVQADEARLHQVVWNMVRNAIKFTPSGGRIALRTRQEAGQLVLSCADSGLGIPADALPRIFSAFEQAGAGEMHRTHGLGLGLAIAHGLVVEHGGTLEAASDGPDQGATFTLRLPLPAEGPGVLAASAADTALPAPVPPGCRVLLVEDNADAAEATRLSLEPFGYRVTHAATCAAALDLASRETFDVVVTDLGLPDGHGADVGRALSGRLPVIALSGYGMPQDIQRSTESGFSGHLIKPTDPDTVHATILAVMRARVPA